MQDFVMLSMTEAEVVAAMTCAWDMLFALHVLESLGLQVKKLMILEVDTREQRT